MVKQDPEFISESNQAPGKGDRAGSGVSQTAPTTQPPAIGSGAPPSNTAPANCKNPKSYVQLLRSGVDSLYVSYPGILPKSKASYLEELKERAKSPDPDVKASASLDLNDHRFEVRDRGKGRFPFVLVDNWFHLQIAGEKAHKLPLAYVQLSSELVTRAGWENALANLSATVQGLDGVTGPPSISRVDICTDFTTQADFEAFPLNAWVARAKQLGCYYSANRLTGYSFGLGGDMSVRIYDKTEEIRKSGKTYFHDLWKAQGWDGQQTVWRLELQYKRSVLRELGVEVAKQLSLNLAALWRYGTKNWLRLTLPNMSDETRSRWPNHPLWDELIDVDWECELYEGLVRVQRARVPDDRYLYVNGISGITSYMATKGISDFNEGLSGFIREAMAYHKAMGIETGADLQSYARLKTNEKAKRYNTPLSNPKPEPDGRTRGEV